MVDVMDGLSDAEVQSLSEPVDTPAPETTPYAEEVGPEQDQSELPVEPRVETHAERTARGRREAEERRQAQAAREAELEQLRQEVAQVRQREQEREQQLRQEQAQRQQADAFTQARQAKIAELTSRMAQARQAGYDADGNAWTEERLQRAAQRELAEWDGQQALKYREDALRQQQTGMLANQVVGGIQQQFSQRAQMASQFLKENYGLDAGITDAELEAATRPGFAVLAKALQEPSPQNLLAAFDLVTTAAAVAVANDKSRSGGSQAVRNAALSAATRQNAMPQGNPTGSFAQLEQRLADGDYSVMAEYQKEFERRKQSGL